MQMVILYANGVCYEPILWYRKFLITVYSNNYCEMLIVHAGTPESTVAPGEKRNHSKPFIIRATDSSKNMLIAEMYMKNEIVQVKWLKCQH